MHLKFVQSFRCLVRYFVDKFPQLHAVETSRKMCSAQCIALSTRRYGLPEAVPLTVRTLEFASGLGLPAVAAAFLASAFALP